MVGDSRTFTNSGGWFLSHSKGMQTGATNKNGHAVYPRKNGFRLHPRGKRHDNKIHPLSGLHREAHRNPLRERFINLPDRKPARKHRSCYLPRYGFNPNGNRTDYDRTFHYSG